MRSSFTQAFTFIRLLLSTSSHEARDHNQGNALDADNGTKGELDVFCTMFNSNFIPST